MKSSPWFWNRVANWYDKRMRTDEYLARSIEGATKYLKPDLSVLDFACGSGIASYKMALRAKEVHGIDLSTKMIEVAKAKTQEHDVDNVRFDQMTIFDERLTRESYDVIVAFNILHLLEDASQGVTRAAELLKPGGLLITDTPCAGESGVILRVLLPFIAKTFLRFSVRKFRIADVTDLMRTSDLEIVESEAPRGALPTCFVVAKKQTLGRPQPSDPVGLLQ